jgi:hypothetical protein
MELWHRWDKRDRPVRIVPDGMRDASYPAATEVCAADVHAERPAGIVGCAGIKKVAAFFSLGVDSFYTLLKNLNAEKGDGRISHLISVHGFDVPLENQELFAKVAAGVQTVADELGLRAIFVSTNLRALSNRFSGWGRYQHGAALASVGLCLQRLFRRIYIGSGTTYADAFPWGSHPLTDPLWSTESLQFSFDGAEASRVQKIKWQVAQSDVALAHLRVCWENRGNRYNCCRCEKCLRTMLNLHVAGALHRCKTFDPTIDLARLRGIVVADANSATFMRENLKALEQSGQDCEMQQCLRQALARRARLRTKIREAIGNVFLRYLGEPVYRCYRSVRHD